MRQGKLVLRILLITLTSLVGVLLFHRTEIFSRLEIFPGDLGDARFVTYIVEHWSQVVLGKARLLSPAFFYPIHGALGYSDALLSYGFFSVPLRIIGGFDPFTVMQFLLIFVSFLNFTSMYLFLKKAICCSELSATIGAFVFAFNSPKANQLNHLQLHATWLLPFMAWLLLRAFKYANISDKKVLWSLIVFGILLNLQLLSSFYFGWFFIFWLGTFFLSILAFSRARHVLLDKLLKSRKVILISLSTFLIGLIPFLLLYLPVYQQGGGRDFSEVASMLPEPRSWFWMGDKNYVWGWLPSLKKHFSSMPTGSEHAIGFGLGILIVFLLVLFHLRNFLVSKYRSKEESFLGFMDSSHKDFLAALVFSVLFIVVLTLKLSGNNSFWYLVFKFVPGASSIRAVSRFALVLSFPLAIITSIFFNHYTHFFQASKSKFKKSFPILLTVLFLIIITEQQQTSIAGFNKLIERSRLDHLINKGLPSSCDSFYVEPAAHVGYPTWVLHIDAMFLSSAFGVPTINGYSGLSPKNWELWEIRSDGYKKAISSWTEVNVLKSPPCRFEIDS